MQKNDFVKKWSYNLLAPSPRYALESIIRYRTIYLGKHKHHHDSLIYLSIFHLNQSAGVLFILQLM